MNKSRIVDLLYKKAQGQNMGASSEELKELRKYKIDAGESQFYTTKSNISGYVTAVDKGYRLSFYDWCIANKKADKRRSGSSAKEMASIDIHNSLSMMILGWLTWGIALYWILGERTDIKSCAIGGAILSFILYRVARKWAAITIILLPIALVAVFSAL